MSRAPLVRGTVPVRPTLSLRRRGLLAALGVAALAHRAKADDTLPPLSDALTELNPPREPPAFSFQTAEGEKRTLADYRDQGVVLNIWATWCAPCRVEMPSLNRLSELTKDFAIRVLPVSIDAKGLSAVKAYYAAHGIGSLPMLTDPDGSIGDAFKIDGIPASFIIDRSGRLVAQCLGAAEWDAPGAVAMIRRLTSQGMNQHELPITVPVDSRFRLSG